MPFVLRSISCPCRRKCLSRFRAILIGGAFLAPSWVVGYAQDQETDAEVIVTLGELQELDDAEAEVLRSELVNIRSGHKLAGSLARERLTDVAAWHSANLQRLENQRARARIIRAVEQEIARENPSTSPDLSSLSPQAQEYCEINEEMATALKIIRDEAGSPRNLIQLLVEWEELNEEAFADLAQLRRIVAEQERLANPQPEEPIRAEEQAIITEIASFFSYVRGLEPRARIEALAANQELLAKKIAGLKQLQSQDAQ